MMKKICNDPFDLRASIAGASLLILTIFGCSPKVPEETSLEDSVTQPPVSVRVAQAEIATLRPMLDLVGAIVAIPEKTAVISPQLGGWVSKLDVVEGQSVVAGDVLVLLDPRSAQVTVQRAEAIVAEKDAAVTRLKSG